MAMGDPSIWQSLRRFFENFVTHYQETTVSYTTTIIATFLFGVNGFVTSQKLKYIFGIGAILFFIFSLAYNYWTGSPFGIDISCTPTHLVEGERKPDKMAEQQGIGLIQNEELVLHGTVQLSRFSNEFELCVQTSSDIGAELRTKPRSEHEYDPASNTLSCTDISEYGFPLTIEVFPKRGVSDGGRYHWLVITDNNSSKDIERFDILNVDY